MITSAEHLAAFALSIKLFTKPVSFIVYNWNQNGFSVFRATSSIEQIDIVDKVKGTPNFSAAFAALISPSARCMPVSPTGAKATGIVTGSFIISELVFLSVISTATRWRRRIFLKSVELSERVCSSQLPETA